MEHDGSVDAARQPVDLVHRSNPKSENAELPSIANMKSPGVSKSLHEKKPSGSENPMTQSANTPSSAAKADEQWKSDTPAIEKMATLPHYIIQRNQLFDELKKKSVQDILHREHPEINVMLDLGVDKNGTPRPLMPVLAKAWESTPGSFLKHVDKDISTDVVIAKVDDRELWDLDRPLEYACRVRYVPFSSVEGRNVFWHSSAHVLGEAAECQYDCLLSHGPPTEQGFFYDMAIADK